MPGLDPLIGQPVAAHQRDEHPGGRIEATPGSGRPLAADVALVCEHRRFIDRDPVPRQRTELSHDPLDEHREPFRCLGRLPAACSRNPAGIREMVQRHDRFHSTTAQRLHDVGVMLDRAGRELAWSRLDAAPFQGEAMRVLMQRLEEVEVGLEAPVMIARWVGSIAVLDMPGHLLPGPPIVEMIPAFDLVGSRCRPPKKPIGKPVLPPPCGEGGGGGAHDPSDPWLTISSTTDRISSMRISTTTAPIGPMTAATARSVEIR